MKRIVKVVTVAAAVAGLTACSSKPVTELTKSGLDPENFKTVFRGDSTALFTLTNEAGMEVCVTNFGGRVVSVMVPDRTGVSRDVVLGFDSIADYLPDKNKSDFGAAIGRYANRIAGGRFTLDGVEYQLPINNFGHSLHGGTDMGTLGWQYRVYEAQQPDASTLVLTLHDADGNNGYPGTVDATVTYKVLPDNTLDITYGAVTDRPTIINMTNHSYFNLSGNPSQPVDNHELTVNAVYFTPVDETFMTTGEEAALDNDSPLNFTAARRIGEVVADMADAQIKYASGIDHNYVLCSSGDFGRMAASLYDPESGIGMEVYTTEPGVQVYTGNFLDGSVSGKNGIRYGRRAGVCLETQHYPDSPNKPQWPTTRLNPGEKYSSHTAYRFYTR